MNLLANWAGVGNVPIFKTMRTLRGLRPLRALSRMQSMKVRYITNIDLLLTSNSLNGFGITNYIADSRISTKLIFFNYTNYI